ncbi:uncharacterized protein A4U43_C05F15870 [Asparagus officinalis]|uniref:Amino acid transporter transmembrane domain-containing protein n=1 Tax=Asparagus officinalis TaxID=4686 RepID=A0A5P1ERW4_ASPOF|nr:uncharacterized protein A4U43_C05F15870 [Asparagus officinalis]
MSKGRKFPIVVLQAFVVVVAMSISFGAFGYMAYGEETEEIITLNLPNSWSAVCVKLGLCISMALTLPMSVHPMHESTERKLSPIQCFQKIGRNSQTKDGFLSQLACFLVVVGLAILAVSA